MSCTLLRTTWKDILSSVFYISLYLILWYRCVWCPFNSHAMETENLSKLQEHKVWWANKTQLSLFSHETCPNDKLSRVLKRLRNVGMFSWIPLQNRQHITSIGIPDNFLNIPHRLQQFSCSWAALTTFLHFYYISFCIILRNNSMFHDFQW